MGDQVFSFPEGTEDTEGVLDSMQIELIMLTPVSDQVAASVLSEFIQGKYTLHIHQLELSTDKEHYQFVQELATFQIDTRAELDEMIERLPKLSGIEMLFLLNPQPDFLSLMN
ncbi:MAG TPA: hypothetical protein VK044_09375 [Virgibacillus sp.]|nr:hypothetical protein [Virgibacillus sp.]